MNTAAYDSFISHRKSLFRQATGKAAALQRLFLLSSLSLNDIQSQPIHFFMAASIMATHFSI